jgi:hypothetical protein
VRRGTRTRDAAREEAGSSLHASEKEVLPVEPHSTWYLGLCLTDWSTFYLAVDVCCYFSVSLSIVAQEQRPSASPSGFHSG